MRRWLPWGDPHAGFAPKVFTDGQVSLVQAALTLGPLPSARLVLLGRLVPLGAVRGFGLQRPVWGEESFFFLLVQEQNNTPGSCVSLAWRRSASFQSCGRSGQRVDPLPTSEAQGRRAEKVKLVLESRNVQLGVFTEPAFKVSRSLPSPRQDGLNLVIPR